MYQNWKPGGLRRPPQKAAPDTATTAGSHSGGSVGVLDADEILCILENGTDEELVLEVGGWVPGGAGSFLESAVQVLPPKGRMAFTASLGQEVRLEGPFGAFRLGRSASGRAEIQPAAGLWQSFAAGGALFPRGWLLQCKLQELLAPPSELPSLEALLAEDDERAAFAAWWHRTHAEAPAREEGTVLALDEAAMGAIREVLDREDATPDHFVVAAALFLRGGAAESVVMADGTEARLEPGPPPRIELPASGPWPRLALEIRSVRPSRTREKWLVAYPVALAQAQASRLARA